MESNSKILFVAILLIPILLVYVYFFSEDKSKIIQTNTETVNQNFDLKKYREIFESKDYEVTQITNSYDINSKIKSKPKITASRKMYFDNGVLVAATLNIDNSILNIYKKDDLRTYILSKDKTYYETNSDPYGDKLKTIAQDNIILTSYNDINNHLDVTKISDFSYEYLDYVTEKLNQNTQVDPKLYEKVYREKKRFKFVFDTKTNLLILNTILSLDQKYIIGSVEFKYKEIDQDKIENIKKIPSGYTEVKE